MLKWTGRVLYNTLQETVIVNYEYYLRLRRFETGTKPVVDVCAAIAYLGKNPSLIQCEYHAIVRMAQAQVTADTTIATTLDMTNIPFT